MALIITYLKGRCGAVSQECDWKGDSLWVQLPLTALLNIYFFPKNDKINKTPREFGGKWTMEVIVIRTSVLTLFF